MTKFLRILPLTWTSSSYYLRFEVLGCRGVSLDGMVRLVNGDDAFSGRAEIFHRDTGVWGTVCANDWDINDANIVCRQLDLTLEANRTGSDFGRGERPIVMNRVACKGTENRLADCPFVCTRYQQCTSSNVAGVVCRPKISTVRLGGASNNSSGRVEVYRDDVWGTVCDNDWGIDDATVICRQLGFSGAEEAKSGAHFGEGDGPVHMDGVACAGSENELGECPSFCWEETKCSHSQDAGVICRNNK